MTVCNHCKLQKIKREAKKYFQEVVIEGDETKTVYVIPKSISEEFSSFDENRKMDYFWAEFMELTNHCVC